MRLLAVLLCLAAIAAPAAAAPSGSVSRAGTANPRWNGRVQVEDKAYFRNIRTYAACLAQDRQAEIESILATPIVSRDHMPLLRRLVSRRECIRGGMEMGLVALRGAFAERLLVLREPSPEAVAEAPADPDWARFRARWESIDGDGMDPEDEALGHALWIGRCAVRRDAAAVLTLLRTEVGTTYELASLRALTPTLSGCAAGTRGIGVDRFEMRAALAEAAYAILVAR